VPGTAKNYAVANIIQGPGKLWVIGTPPVDATPRLTLASDGTPDSVTHGTCIDLGAIQSAITNAVKPKMTPIALDQYDAPFDSYLQEEDATIEAELAQTEASKLQRALGVGAYSTGSGYKQTTFGGLTTVPTACIAAISPTRANPNRYYVSTLFSAASVGGFEVSMGRAKASAYKAKFQGLMDLTRTAGKQTGIWHQTLADAAGGTPTAPSVDVTEIFQGPYDLWILPTAPTDGAVRVTLDSSTLTPDSAAHPASVHLGLQEGAGKFTVIPKLTLMKADQVTGAIGVYISGLTAKIEAEMSQSSMSLLSQMLMTGAYTLSGGQYDQFTFGGGDKAAAFCLCMIGKKRTDATKAVVCCLYKVNSVAGVDLTMSRQKRSSWKVEFDGMNDITRTAGRQMGVYHEMI